MMKLLFNVVAFKSMQLQHALHSIYYRSGLGVCLWWWYSNSSSGNNSIVDCECIKLLSLINCHIICAQIKKSVNKEQKCTHVNAPSVLWSAILCRCVWFKISVEKINGGCDAMRCSALDLLPHALVLWFYNYFLLFLFIRFGFHLSTTPFYLSLCLAHAEYAEISGRTNILPM